MPDSDDRKKEGAARRRRYETPVVVDLGELARGSGASCLRGSAPIGTCKYGAQPTGTCDVGVGN